MSPPPPQSSFERGILRVLDAVVTRSRRRAPWVVLALALATAGAGVYAARHLGLNADLDALLSDRLPYMQVRRDFDRALPMVDDELLLVVDARTPERAAEAAEVLAARLESEPGAFQEVFVPGGGPFFSRNALLYLSVDELDELADNLAEAQPYLAEIARDPSVRGIFGLLELALESIPGGRTTELDPGPLLDRTSEGFEAVLAGGPGSLGWGEIVFGEAAGADPAHRVVILSPVLDYSDLQPARKPVEAVRRVASELGFEGGDVRVRLTGDFALSYDEMAVARRQAGGAAVSSFVLVAILLAAALRSAWLIASCLLLLVSGLVLNVGFAAAAVGHLNPISVAFAVLFIGLGVDYAIHFCLHYQDQRVAGEPHASALSAAARDVGSSIVLCAASTAVGFYAFLPTDFKGVAELGLISGTGMLIALVLTLTLLPAMMSLAPRATRERWGRPPRGPRIGEIVIPTAHPARVLLVTGVLGAASLALLPQAYFDSNPLRVRDPHSESVQALADLLGDADRSPWTLSVLAPDLESAHAIAERLEDLPVVERVVEPLDAVPPDQEEKLERIGELELFMVPPPADGPPPSLAETVAALDALLAEIDAFGAAEPGSPLAPQAARLRAATAALREHLLEGGEARLRALEQDLVHPIVWRLRKLHEALGAEPFGFEDLPRALRDQLVTVDGRVRVEIFPAEDVNDNAALARFVDGVHAVEPRAVGPAGNFLTSARIIAASFEQALALAFAAIGLLLFLLWRRLEDTLLVLGILALSALLTVAAAVAAGIPFNFANVIVLPLLLGACVESSVHLVHRYRHEVSVRGELLRTSTARAVFYTALTTIASFGTLGFATHRGMASMGRLLTLGLLINLACNLVVLPALLNRRPARKP